MITLLGARFAEAYVKPSDPTFSEVPTKIQDHPIYWPHFKDCIGAIDGTHVIAIVQHTTPTFFLILFVHKVTTFRTHHQGNIM
ncbi:hypothetical protein CMV_017212 [Castanea mollissima]|uniref:DDE Tnp4 domain-containing protein n=1 Tax=Castanea mollissima TaxID=60419 RepID=A0A8J4R579_9ROSI|nr:hypothetical protein CMV_017212 [Castanea mollissima]